MPNITYQDAIKEAFALAPADQVILDTLEIRQGTVQEPVYLVRSSREIYAKTEDAQFHLFIPVGFQITLPAENTEGFRSLNITIDNVGKSVLNFINTSKSHRVPVEVVYRPYLNTDLSTPQMNPPLVFYLKDIQVTPQQIVGKATFMELVNRKFPSELYTRLRFPFLQ